MVLSHRKQFLFIHVPKAAGGSVTRALAVYEDRGSRLRRGFGAPLRRLGIGPWLAAHARARELRDRLPRELFDRLFKFALVRNPWDREVSRYLHLCSTRSHRHHRLVKGMNGFEEYVAWRTARRVRQQSDYVCDTRGRLLVDFVGRYEELQQSFRCVCTRLGLSVSIPHIHRSRSRLAYFCYYNARTRRMVGDAFREDVERFGYSFAGEEDRAPPQTVIERRAP